MKIFLRILTGQGIRLQGEISLADLPAGLAQQAKLILQEKTLAVTAAAQPNPQMVDASQYELVIFPNTPNDQPQRYTLVDADDNIDVLELLDEIMYHIIRRKKGML